MPFKIHEIIFFSDKKESVPTLPKIFRPVTQNTYFGIWPNLKHSSCEHVISIRLEKSVDPDQMATSEAS